MKYVISSIPFYAMAKIPVRVCDEVEKLSRAFLWRGDMYKKGWVLVAWKNICKPKCYGGLGI